MKHSMISDSIQYAGVFDQTIDLFESQYPVPQGVTYNSYVIMDQKTAVMDTVDPRKTAEWLANLKTRFKGATPDYLVISHLEPDHAGSFAAFLEVYPDTTIVTNAKALAMLGQFFELPSSTKTQVVKEGDTLSLGAHTLTFVMAPMVHWPEVMVAYESLEKVLFSADGFGTFGSLEQPMEAWPLEARRYFINIVGKYGIQVQNLLKKASNLDIRMICPLHGPILKAPLDRYLQLYDTWSSYRAEEEGIVIAYASIHGNTARAAKALRDLLNTRGAKNVLLYDLARDPMSEVIASAYRYDRLVLACATYDGALFPCMEDFLYHLRCKNFQNRKVALMENGSWAPMAAKLMRAELDTLKNITILSPILTIKSALKPAQLEELSMLADELLK